MPVATQEHLDAAVQLVESGSGGEAASVTSTKSEGGSQVRGLRLVLLAPDEDAADSTANLPTSNTKITVFSTTATATGQPFAYVSHAHTLSGQSSDSGLAPAAVAPSTKSSTQCPSGRSSWSSMSGLSGDSGTGALSLARLDLRGGDRSASTNYLFVRPPIIAPSEVDSERRLLEAPGGSFPRAHPAPPQQPPLQGERSVDAGHRQSECAPVSCQYEDHCTIWNCRQSHVSARAAGAGLRALRGGRHAVQRQETAAGAATVAGAAGPLAAAASGGCSSRRRTSSTCVFLLYSTRTYNIILSIM